MSSVLIRDEAIAAAIAAAEPGELRGPDGRLLAYITPPPPPKMTYPELGITDDELDRRLHDPNAKWVTPEQVMERLREIDRGPKAA